MQCPAFRLGDLQSLEQRRNRGGDRVRLQRRAVRIGEDEILLAAQDQCVLDQVRHLSRRAVGSELLAELVLALAMPFEIRQSLLGDLDYALLLGMFVAFERLEDQPSSLLCDNDLEMVAYPSAISDHLKASTSPRGAPTA